MVGEGKWNADNLRTRETRGQIFNELLRHRATDKQKDKDVGSGPILLFAFDKSWVEIDLAFPSTKGGKLESDKAVGFSNLGPGDGNFLDLTDTQGGHFWIGRIKKFAHCSSIHSGWRNEGRVQYKMPLPHCVGDKTAAAVQYRGENVTIIENTTGAKFVYKEYAYHLRQESDFMETGSADIQEGDKMRPPS